jgi:hypothetical protein
MRYVDLIPYVLSGAAILIPASRLRRQRLDRWRRTPAEKPTLRLKDHIFNGLLASVLCVGLVAILFGPKWPAIAAFLLLLGCMIVQEASLNADVPNTAIPRRARATLHGLLLLEVIGFAVMFWPVTFLRLYRT